MNRLSPSFELWNADAGSARGGLRDNLALFYRQARLIAIITITVAGAVLGWAISSPPDYVARVTLLADPGATLLIDQQQDFPTGSASTARLDSEVELARSETVLRAVLSSLGMPDRPEFAPRRGVMAQIADALGEAGWIQKAATGEADMLARLSRMISIKRRGLTHIFDIEVTHENPELAAEIANTLAAAHIDQQVAAKSQAALAARQTMSLRIATVRAALLEADAGIDLYLADNLDRLDWPDVDSFIDAMARERIDVAALGEVQALLADGNSYHDPLSSIRLDEVENRLDLTRAELDGLRLRLREQIPRIDLAPDIAADLFALIQRSEHARGLYQTLMAQAQRLEAAAIAQLPDTRIVVPASVPAHPDSPDFGFSASLGIALGLALGTGAAVMRNAYAGEFHTARGARASLGLGHFLTVPRVPTSRSTARSIADMLITAPVSPFTESIRRLRLTLEQNVTISTRAPIVLIASAGPAEGKTTIALALARAFAEAGCKTLAIDADLRRPGLGEAVGYLPDMGMAEVLASGRDEFFKAVLRDPLSAATLLLGGRASTGATDHLLRLPAFADLLEVARRDHDIVLIDTAPLGPVVDTHYLVQKADAVVLVIDWAQTSQTAASGALEALRRAGIGGQAVVAVFNRVSGPAGTEQRYAAYAAEERD